jgi:hypothetical protein
MRRWKGQKQYEDTRAVRVFANKRTQPQKNSERGTGTGTPGKIEIQLALHLSRRVSQVVIGLFSKDLSNASQQERRDRSSLVLFTTFIISYRTSQ